MTIQKLILQIPYQGHFFFYCFFLGLTLVHMFFRFLILQLIFQKKNIRRKSVFALLFWCFMKHGFKLSSETRVQNPPERVWMRPGASHGWFWCHRNIPHSWATSLKDHCKQRFEKSWELWNLYLSSLLQWQFIEFEIAMLSCWLIEYCKKMLHLSVLAINFEICVWCFFSKRVCISNSLGCHKVLQSHLYIFLVNIFIA